MKAVFQQSSDPSTWLWCDPNSILQSRAMLSFLPKKDLKLVERMQRLATRCVKGLCGLQYPARLRELQLSHMHRHILRSTLITAYNIFHGNLNLHLKDAPNSWTSIQGPSAPVHLTRRQSAFVVRVVGPWNRYSPFVAEAAWLNRFEERLDNCLETIFPEHTISLVNL